MMKYLAITITVLLVLFGCRESEDKQTKVDELIIYLKSKCGEASIEIMEGEEEKIEFKIPEKVAM